MINVQKDFPDPQPNMLAFLEDDVDLVFEAINDNPSLQEVAEKLVGVMRADVPLQHRAACILLLVCEGDPPLRQSCLLEMFECAKKRREEGL